MSLVGRGGQALLMLKPCLPERAQVLQVIEHQALLLLLTEGETHQQLHLDLSQDLSMLLQASHFHAGQPFSQ